MGCCNDEETPTAVAPHSDEIIETIYTANHRAFALKSYDFIGDGSKNIKRLDSDNVRIDINEGLLTYLNISELKEDDGLTLAILNGMPVSITTSCPQFPLLPYHSMAVLGSIFTRVLILARL